MSFRAWDGIFLTHFLLTLLIQSSYGYFKYLIRKLQCEIESIVSQSCLTLCDPMDYSPRQNTRVGNCFFLQGIFPTQGLNQVSHIAGRFFTRKAHEY